MGIREAARPDAPRQAGVPPGSPSSRTEARASAAQGKTAKEDLVIAIQPSHG